VVAFYRDGPQWEALRRSVLPRLRAGSRALSAGCAGGEEAWTLALLMQERFRGDPWRVLGVDQSVPALSAARSGQYPRGALQEVPRELLQRFLPPSVDGVVRLPPELAGRVTFERRDLAEGVPEGRYGVILCRNVLRWLQPAGQVRLAQSLVRALEPGGALVVGRGEVDLVRAVGAGLVEAAPGLGLLRTRVAAA
jgi:chemotaxis protein methyltransferase CheR